MGGVLSLKASEIKSLGNVFKSSGSFINLIIKRPGWDTELVTLELPECQAITTERCCLVALVSLLSQLLSFNVSYQDPLLDSLETRHVSSVQLHCRFAVPFL